MREPGRFTLSRLRASGGNGGGGLPFVSLSLSPEASVGEMSPVGAVVASIATDATSLVLGGTDAGLLAISGTNVVTTTSLVGKTVLDFAVIGFRDTYEARARSAFIPVVPPPDQLDARVTPNPLVAGQAFTVTFTAPPDDVVSNVTLSGTGVTRTGTAPTDDTINVSIGATLSGYTSFSGVFDVLPAPAALVREGNFATITGATEPVSITVSLPDDPTSPLNGAHTGPAASQTGAPVWIAGPWLTVDGPDLVLDPGTLYIQDARLASVDWDWPDLTSGPRWPYRPEDEGTTFPLTLNAVDDLGREASVTVSVAIPAQPLAAGITDLGFFMGTNTADVTSKDIAIDLGAADATKTMIVAVEWGPETLENVSKAVSSVKIVKDAVEYLGTFRKSQTIYLKGRKIELWEIPCAVGGAATLRIGGTSTTFPGAAYVLAGKNVGFITTSTANNLGNSVSMTAGAQFGSTRTTVVGDHVLFFAIADQINATGLFTPSANLTEAYDQTIRSEHQLLIAKGTATTTSTTSGATPTASGLAAFIHAIYRNNP